MRERKRRNSHKEELRPIHRFTVETRSVVDDTAGPFDSIGYEPVRSEQIRYKRKQEVGDTIVPLESEDIRPRIDWNESDPEPVPRQEVQIRYTDAPVGNFDPANEARIHYQREWLWLDEKCINHDMIHLAVTLVLSRLHSDYRGFPYHSGAAQLKDVRKGKYNTRTVSYYDNNRWPTQNRIEEAIVDALEAAGIREGKIRENFWTALQKFETLEKIQIPEEYTNRETIAAICDELERLSTEHSEPNTTEHLLP